MVPLSNATCPSNLMALLFSSFFLLLATAKPCPVIALLESMLCPQSPTTWVSHGTCPHQGNSPCFVHSPLLLLLFGFVFEVWHGVCFVHQREYRGGVFKFVLYIPEQYPEARPSVVFFSDVYHPLVDPLSRELDLSHRFPTWTLNKDFIHHILAYIKEIFLRIPRGHFIHKEAHRLLQANPAAFEEKAQASAHLSQARLFEHHEDSSLAFSEMAEPNFEKYKRLMLNFDKARADEDFDDDRADYLEEVFREFPDVRPSAAEEEEGAD